MKNKFQSRKGQFSPAGATFMHEIHLDPDCKTNRQQKLVGYSRNSNYPEAYDKAYVLKSSIYRILPKYFNKMLVIDYHRKADLTRDDFSQNRFHILRIWQGKYDTVKTDDLVAKIEPWLDAFLLAMTKQEDIGPFKPTPPRRNLLSYEDMLDSYIINRKFSSQKALESFCQAQIKQGRERGLLVHFWRQYCQRHFRNI